MEKELRVDHERKMKEMAVHKKKLDALIAEYKKIQRENETLQASIDSHRSTVEALRKEAVRFSDSLPYDSLDLLPSFRLRKIF